MKMSESKLRKIIKEEILAENIPSHGIPHDLLFSARKLALDVKNNNKQHEDIAKLAKAIEDLTVILQADNLARHLEIGKDKYSRKPLTPRY